MAMLYLLVGAVVVALVPSTFADDIAATIKCYKCGPVSSSTGSGSCSESGFNITDPNVRTVDCASGSCLKNRTEYSSSVTVERLCDSTYHSEGCRHSSTDGIFQRVCYCNTDLCNDEPSEGTTIRTTAPTVTSAAAIISVPTTGVSDVTSESTISNVSTVNVTDTTAFFNTTASAGPMEGSFRWSSLVLGCMLLLSLQHFVY